jgi:hypothetical protein
VLRLLLVTVSRGHDEKYEESMPLLYITCAVLVVLRGAGYPVAVDLLGGPHVTERDNLGKRISLSHTRLDITGESRRVRQGIISGGSRSEAHHYGTNSLPCLVVNK